MKSKTLFGSTALVVLAGTLLSGCGSKHPATGGSPGSAVAGTWKGDGSAATDPTVKSMAESMSLDLKEDQSFSASMGVAMEGTWTASGKTVTLNLMKLAGSDIADMHKMAAGDKGAADDFGKPIVLELSADDKTLTVTQTQTGPPAQPMVFRKQG